MSLIFRRVIVITGGYIIFDTLFILFAQPVEMEFRHFKRFIILIFILFSSYP